MASSPLKRSSSFSERLYRLLLLSYPAKFRQRYGYEMLQTFRCYRQELLQRDDKWGVARLWSFVAYDLAKTVFIEHWKEFDTHLKRFFAISGRKNNSLIPQFSLNVAQRTDIGRLRESNEDNLASVIPDDPEVLASRGALFVVADGLGGHKKGEVASDIAVRSISDAYYQDKHDEIPISLQQAVQQANRNIRDANSEMGTTCVAAVLQGDTAYIANVGDSRAYIVRNGSVKQISQDHSIVADEMRAGLITADQARNHPQRNIITRCLGTKTEVEVDIFSEKVQEGDLLVLCTDGLSAVVTDEELGAILQQFQPQDSAYQLIERANEQGGPDNITAIVVQVSHVSPTV
ncbi:MAG TPA: Stp1/IreP family PP2C-type Ser/Thr phosphatase [Ktedonobacter sp.]|nr:Stp1/IreP family PP2C-type Ser/Thr phosphatase [Ktedonobacter sp.]